MIKLGFVCLAGDDFDYQWAAEIFNKTKEQFKKINANIITHEKIILKESDIFPVIENLKKEFVDFLIIQNATFAWGGYVVNLVTAVDVPVILWAIPEPEMYGRLRSNSLCGVNMNASALYRLNKYYKYFYTNWNDENIINSINKFINVINAIKKLKETKIGLVGYRVPGFYGSTFDELKLKQEIGPSVHHIELLEIKDEMEKVTEIEIKKVIDETKGKVKKINLEENKLKEYAKMVKAFKNIAEKYACNALAVKCWPEPEKFIGIGTCAAMSKLTDDGLICGCEADVYGTVTMLIQNYISGKIPFIVDFVYMDEKENTGVLWHCGNAPFSLAQDKNEITICGLPHCEFGCKGGFVTFAKLGTEYGENGDCPNFSERKMGLSPSYRMLISSGEGIANKMIFKGTSALVKFTPNVKDLLDLIIYNGFEHHFSIVYEDIIEETEDLCKILKIKINKIINNWDCPPTHENKSKYSKS